MLSVTVSSGLTGERVLENGQIQPDDKIQVLHQQLQEVLGQSSVKLLATDGRYLPKGSTAAECGLEDGSVISFAVQPAVFKYWDEKGSSFEDGIFKKISGQPDFSTATGFDEYSQGVHSWTFKRVGSKPELLNCFLGICSGEFPSDKGPSGADKYVCFSDFQGDLRTKFGDDGLKTAARDLSRLTDLGSTIEITLDCEAHVATFCAPGNAEPMLGTVTDLPDVPWRVFISLDEVGDAWELVESC